MYKYYKELDNPNDFKIRLSRSDIDRRNYKSIANPSVDSSFYVRYEALFKYIKVIDGLVITDDIPFVDAPPLKDDYMYEEMERLKKKIELSIWDLLDILKFYYEHLAYYRAIFPKMYLFWDRFGQMLASVLKEINAKLNIKLPNLSQEIIMPFPNAWYITPGGYLYNTGTGHKEGNLVYAYGQICSSFNHKAGIKNDSDYVRLEPRETLEDPNHNCKFLSDQEKIQRILQDGCAPMYEFLNYSNLSYCNGSNVTYQKNIITLVLGFLSARSAFCKAYDRLNDSPQGYEHVREIGKLTKGDLGDILVRFAGFNKVESQERNLITTSSVKGIENFGEYLDRGWEIAIVPGIVYDEVLDEINVMDLDSAFIDHYLSENLSWPRERRIRVYRGK